MQPDRWSEETREALAKLIAKRYSDVLELPTYEPYVGPTHREIADEILTALADAGLLVPPDAETAEEWAITDARGIEYCESKAHARSQFVRYYGSTVGARIVRRTVHEGPWREVTDAP